MRQVKAMEKSKSTKGWQGGASRRGGREGRRGEGENEWTGKWVNCFVFYLYCLNCCRRLLMKEF